MPASAFLSIIRVRISGLWLGLSIRLRGSRFSCSIHVETKLTLGLSAMRYPHVRFQRILVLLLLLA
jgi:hypothetical protein